MQNEITNKERVLTNLLAAVQKSNEELTNKVNELEKENEMLNNLFNGSIKKVSEQREFEFQEELENKDDNLITIDMLTDLEDIIQDFGLIDFIKEDFLARIKEDKNISGVLIDKKFKTQVLKHDDVYFNKGFLVVTFNDFTLDIEFSEDVDGCDYGFIG